MLEMVLEDELLGQFGLNKEVNSPLTGLAIASSSSSEMLYLCR
jgi:hypothetical protein